MQFKELTITPAIAKKYLETNPNNRRVKEKVVNLYAREMVAGRWKNGTAETIKISKEGLLIDGQHRLSAVIKANKPVKFTFAFNVDKNVFDVLDTGSLRSSGDTFKVQGIKNDTLLPPIISTYLLLKHGRRATGTQKDVKPTNIILLEEYMARDQYWQYVVTTTLKWYSAFARILTPSIIGGMYSMFQDINKEDAGSFMNQLCTGFDVKNKTISYLRNKLMQDKLATYKMSTAMKYAIIIKAWNCYRKKDEMKFLKYDPSKEEFPIAI